MALNLRWACRLLGGTLLWAVWSAPAGAATPEDARRAYNAGNFTDAMGIWAELSRQGNAEAEFGLGLLYDVGNGTPVDPQAAFAWYKMAAEAGFVPAEFNVAAMYDSGRGVVQSVENAALWYARAAARGHHRAQFDLGLLYQDGQGVPANADAAAVWLRDALDGGVTAAGVRLKALTAAQAARPHGELAAVTLNFPPRNASVAIIKDDPAVELVWLAPAEPETVHYVVQVRTLGDADMRTLLTTTVSETSLLVRLPAGSGFYAWNVDTVGRDGRHAAGDWNWFSVEPAAKPGQAVASGPNQLPAPH